MPKNNVVQFIKSNSDSYYWKDYFTEDGLERVKTYIGNVSKGQPKVWKAPFAKGDSMEKILKDWRAILVSIEDKWPSLMDFENDLAKKVGPLSVQKPLRERMPDIESYWDDILLPSKPVDSLAIKSVVQKFARLRPVQVRSQRNTVEEMKKSSQAGNPYWLKRRDVISETLPTYSKIIDEEVSMSCNLWHGNACAVVGWRGQEGGPSEEDVKQRVIWMFPFGVNIRELQIYQPIIEGAQKHNIVPAWVSNDQVDKEITALFDTKNSDDLIVCTDFSKFDQHFNQHMQDCAKSILEMLIAHTKEGETWLEEIFPIKYNIPLLWDVDHYWGDVSLFTGHHGMASGSGGTNLDETLAHTALQHEVAMLNGAQLNPHSQCLGDDGILSYPGITVDDVVEAYESHGQICNKDKQYASTQDCIYLRRWHHKDYRENGVCTGVYSTCRALGKLRYLERFMDPKYWSPELVALRQLSIIENCNHHPLFDEFVQFCMKRDKYRLGIDIPGFLDNITQFAEESIDHMPDFLGYTKTLQGEGPSGISDWRVVKYLKSVR